MFANQTQNPSQTQTLVHLDARQTNRNQTNFHPAKPEIMPISDYLSPRKAKNRHKSAPIWHGKAKKSHRATPHATRTPKPRHLFPSNFNALRRPPHHNNNIYIQI